MRPEFYEVLACPVCEGSGERLGRSCGHCYGNGSIVLDLGVLRDRDRRAQHDALWLAELRRNSAANERLAAAMERMAGLMEAEARR